ncbi:MAG: 5-formyltetrahydrofolate cyclo-ligase [Clostridiales bacterium]|nr:5-formyltetrahydrofolate cyclo-ligase [Clostridiales bacterium]
MADKKINLSVQEMTARINELYHKSQSEGLNDEEKKEQAELRRAYVANVKANLKAQLDNISVVEKDGTITRPADREKKHIRKKCLLLRDEIPPKLREEKSDKIIGALCGLEQYKKADIILTYVNYQSEVITTKFIERALADKKLVFAPRVSGNEMEFYKIDGIDSLTEGYKGIKEPIGAEAFLDKIRAVDLDGENNLPLMIMPGAAFDKEGHRIGYGKGYYDKYLSRIDKAGINVYKIALCYECQLLDSIAHEEHDVCVDMVVTEEDLYEYK